VLHDYALYKSTFTLLYNPSTSASLSLPYPTPPVPLYPPSLPISPSIFSPAFLLLSFSSHPFPVPFPTSPPFSSYQTTEPAVRGTSGLCSTVHRSIITKWQRLPAGYTYVVYCLAAIDSLPFFFYWIRVKVVQQQQLTCLKLDRPNGPSYSTDELLNTSLVGTWFHVRYSSAV